MKIHYVIGLAIMLSISAASNAQAGNIFRVFSKDLRAGTSASGETTPASSQDPYHDQVAFLAQFDGAEGSRVFNDTTGFGGSASSTGTARVSATNKLFGTGSLTLDGSSTVTYPYSVGASATSDFTVEFWVRLTSNGSANWATMVDGGFSFAKFDGSTGSWMGNATTAVHDLYLQAGGTNVNSQKLIIARAAQWRDGLWHHVAVSRQGGVLRGFIDGAQPMPSIAGANWAYPMRPVVLGWGTNGGIDDMRVTNGVARYTAPFTPPSSAFIY